MSTNLPSLPVLRRLSALALFAGASSFTLAAQQVQAAGPAAAVEVADALNGPLNLSSGLNYSSSAHDVASPVDSVAAERLALGAGMQPPPRRRYGRPRYNDNMHNPDGSNKYAFVAGVGATAPLGNTYHYLNTNYAFQVGAGRNFNKNFAIMFQFDYDRFGFNGRTLYNQQALYNYCPPQFNNQCQALSSVDGNTHVWSFSFNPSYNFYQSEGVGAYVVGGVGFYHKVADFTTPTNALIYTYYGPVQYTQNTIIDHYTSNAPGFNGGIGLTYKPSRFAGERLFAEARYVFVDNSQRSGLTVNNNSSTFNATTVADAYPANSNRTTYTVYKAGIRF